MRGQRRREGGGILKKERDLLLSPILFYGVADEMAQVEEILLGDPIGKAMEGSAIIKDSKPGSKVLAGDHLLYPILLADDGSGMGLFKIEIRKLTALS